MSLARMQMTPAPNARKGQLELWADIYMDDLRRNGQIIGSERPYAWQHGILNYYVEIPRPDALENKYNSAWAQHDLDKLLKLLAAPPTWSLIDDAAAKLYPGWKSAAFLYLSPAWNNSGSPVFRGNDGRSIPLYLLPIGQWERQEIMTWQDYAETYSFLWCKSGTMEIPAWRQMSEPESEHSRKGRKICQWIEKGTGIPTFYELDRYYAHAEGEASRPCPVCGQPWNIPQRWPGKQKAWDFAFKCDACHLVSHLGVDKDIEKTPARQERLASIGDYRARKQRK
jgi:predicted  nucleic acid-binding Zn ribbon protein